MNRIATVALSLIITTSTIACTGNPRPMMPGAQRSVPLGGYFNGLTAVKEGRGAFNRWVYPKRGGAIEKFATVTVPPGSLEINLSGPMRAYTISIGAGKSEILVPTNFNRRIPVSIGGKHNEKNVTVHISYSCDSMSMEECLGNLATLLGQKAVSMRSVGAMMLPDIAGNQSPLIFIMSTDPDGKIPE